MPKMTATFETASPEVPEESALTDAFDALVERLSHQSVVKHFDAYTDIAWDEATSASTRGPAVGAPRRRSARCHRLVSEPDQPTRARLGLTPWRPT